MTFYVETVNRIPTINVQVLIVKYVESVDVVHPMNMTLGSDGGEDPADINFEAEENLDYMMRAVTAKPKIKAENQQPDEEDTIPPMNPEPN